MISSPRSIPLTGIVDNAATIEVNPSLVADPSLLDSNAGAPDPSITQTLSSNLAERTTAAAAAPAGCPRPTGDAFGANYAGQVIGSAATTAAAATSNANDQSALLSQMQSQYSSATGVNLDSELSTLIVVHQQRLAAPRRG